MLYYNIIIMTFVSAIHAILFIEVYTNLQYIIDHQINMSV